MNRNIPIQIYGKAEATRSTECSHNPPGCHGGPQYKYPGWLLDRPSFFHYEQPRAKNTTTVASTTFALVQSLRRGNISTRYEQSPKETDGNRSIFTLVHPVSSTSSETILRLPQLDFNFLQKQQHFQDAS